MSQQDQTDALPEVQGIGPQEQTDATPEVQEVGTPPPSTPHVPHVPVAAVAPAPPPPQGAQTTGEPGGKQPRGEPTAEYHYVAHGPQPADRSMLVVHDPNGVRQNYPGGGTPVTLTEAQHDFYLREGHIFVEDIVQTEGG